MKVDLNDIAFWMDAIRNNEDHFGVLESFWKGQLQSKQWLIECLSRVVETDKQNKIVIHGGWNGVLSSLLFNSNIPIRSIRSVDIDPACEEVANMVCKRQEMAGLFTAITEDMCTYQYDVRPDIVINTSTEHITQEQYNIWFDNIPEGTLVVVQNNDYESVPDHIRCFSNQRNFKRSTGLVDIVLKETLQLPLYNRFLVIGKK